MKPQVPIYMAAQYLGAFLAAVAIWGEYADAIKMVSSITTNKIKRMSSHLLTG